MIKRRLCREYIEEIERLERSIRELEEEIIELRMQLKRKTDEVTSLSIENTSLRYKIELLERRERQIIEFLKKLKIPFVIVREEELEDLDSGQNCGEKP
ncbi:hypothetical protein [Thermococcus sp. AM4]|uniref:hypothetical protein n=1 Tax=Thermococcus sp. (strain AM4) TaxID=246969 RepID=UPI0001870E98|nr:hypothetical protein [Thermococcus sp. AM4]EEB73436.1 hypothetical protein TAM4_1184 [Thermococcus sp. AM4]